jgi:hypothetical protein
MPTLYLADLLYSRYKETNGSIMVVVLMVAYLIFGGSAVLQVPELDMSVIKKKIKNHMITNPVATHLADHPLPATYKKIYLQAQQFPNSQLSQKRSMSGSYSTVLSFLDIYCSRLTRS